MFASQRLRPTQHKDDLTACANWIFVHCQGIGLSADIFETPATRSFSPKPSRNDKKIGPIFWSTAITTFNR